MKDFSKCGTFYTYISYQQELLEPEEQPSLFFVSQLYVWLAFSWLPRRRRSVCQQEKPYRFVEMEASLSIICREFVSF